MPHPDGNILLINAGLTNVQKSFIYGREIGYQYMRLKNRLFTTSLVESNESMIHDEP